MKKCSRQHASFTIRYALTAFAISSVTVALILIGGRGASRLTMSDLWFVAASELVIYIVASVEYEQLRSSGRRPSLLLMVLITLGVAKLVWYGPMWLLASTLNGDVPAGDPTLGWVVIVVHLVDLAAIMLMLKEVKDAIIGSEGPGGRVRE